MSAQAGGARTVPQIFADGKHVGDCDTIYRLDKEGKLNHLLGIK